MTSQVEAKRNYALYGGRQTVTLIPGDGIGPEVTNAVKQVFLCAGISRDLFGVDS